MKAIERVLQAVLQSTEDLCATGMALDVTPAEQADPPAISQPEPHGRASIALTSDRVALRLSLIAGMGTCSKLAKALLGGGENEESDGLDLDVADGVGEMMNIIAGGVKKQLHEPYPSLRVGFPVWTIGDRVEDCPRRVLSETRPILIGGNLVQLGVMMGGSGMDLPFPEPEDIVELFMPLTSGRVTETQVSKQTTLLGKEAWPFFVGFYQADGESAPCAAIVLDPTLAFAASGSLSGFAPGVILEDLKAAKITAELRSTVHEILNIAGSLLNASFAPHLRLTEVCELESAPKDGLARLLAEKPRRLDLGMTIAPCPSGKIIILRAA